MNVVFVILTKGRTANFFFRNMITCTTRCVHGLRALFSPEKRKKIDSNAVKFVTTWAHTSSACVELCDVYIVVTVSKNS